MIYPSTAIHRQRGLTLTEVMVAIVISSILMLGVYQIYISSKRGYNLNDSLARVQENMRFATDMMVRDIRMAGYTGCKGLTTTNALEDTDGTYTNFTQPINGYEGGVSTFPVEFPAVGTAKGNRVANTDGLVVLRAGSTGFRITEHKPAAAEIKIDRTNHGIEDDDILFISDCRHSSIFQATNTSQTNATVVHNTGKASTGPGNCWKKIGPPTTPPPSCGGNNGTTYTYGSDARVYRYIAHGYFIGVSQSGITKSLYMQDMKKGIVTAQELVEGVVNMQVIYGIDTDNDGLAEEYVPANLADFDKVVSVRLGLLLESMDEPRTNNTTVNSFNLASTTINVTPDKRIRFSLNSTVKVRNRGIN